MMDEVFELACNLDDMTPEDVGFAMEHLLESGALDVYTLPIGMKKNRPGTMLCVLCKPEDRQRMAENSSAAPPPWASGRRPMAAMCCAGKAEPGKPPLAPSGKSWQRGMAFPDGNRNMRIFAASPWNRACLPGRCGK